MARFRIELPVAAPPGAVWSRLTDWPAHARWIPLTRIRLTSDRPDRVGASSVARTGVGPFAIDDSMVVDEFRPPPTPGSAGSELPPRFRIRKTGRVVLGWAQAQVQASGDATVLVWVEEIRLAPERLTRPFGPLIALAAKVGYSMALRRMAREVEAEASAHGR